MRYLELSKIEIKKTKAVATISLETNGNYTDKDNFKRLLAISVLNGGAGNCLRQISKVRLTKNVNFEQIEQLQEQAETLIYQMIQEINNLEISDGIVTDTHNFK